MGSWETAGKGFVNRMNTSCRPSAAGSRPRPHWSPHPPRPAGWGGGKMAASKLQKRRSAQEATLNEPHLLQVHFDLFLRPHRTHSDLMLPHLGLDVRGFRLASPLPTPLPSTGCHLYVLNDWLPALACSMFLHSLAIMECSGCGDHVHPNPFLRGAQGSCGKGVSLLAGVQTFTHLCVRLRTCSGKGLEGIPRKVSREGGWQCRTRRGPLALGQHPSRHEGPRVSQRGGELEAGGGPSSSGLPGRAATELGTALDCGRPVMGFPGLLQGPREGALGVTPQSGLSVVQWVRAPSTRRDPRMRLCLGHPWWAYSFSSLRSLASCTYICL
ncbi:uncharacterized protein LOC110742049 [Papio anubis]|uniref:uncharacterized protein LOC110742049 n=1 Tax=Papio anubis TaxID=9555 RepID=UPI0012AD9021|nr:uncharacterized protein LOC110742049 [Papio anubis]